MDESNSARADTLPAVNYGLRWGIKDSFVAYIGRMPDGKVSVGAGAYHTETGAFAYSPVQSARRTDLDGVEARIWEFAGDVRFGGHFGMLFVRIASPTIAVRGGVGELTVADPYAREEEKRQVLATVRLEPVEADEGLVEWRSNEVRLHESAVEVFNEVYPAGEALEQFSILLPER